MTKNNVHTLAYIVVLFLFASITSNVYASVSQATVNVPGPLFITILGSNPEHVILGGTYTDAGATVLDTSNGVITVTTISNTVDTSIADVYSVVYRAVDIAGSVATATRVVNVVKPTTRRKAQSPDVTFTGVGGDIEPIAILPTVSVEQVSVLPADFCFNKNLNSYQSDPDVKNLQIFLDNLGFSATSSGSENNYYGKETISAVKWFQEQNVIVPFMPFNVIVGNGNFDDATRSKANDILGCNPIAETIVNTNPSENIGNSGLPVTSSTVNVLPSIVPKIVTSTSGQAFVNTVGLTTGTTGKTSTNIQVQGNIPTSTTLVVYNPNIFQIIANYVISISKNFAQVFRSLFGF